MLVRTTCCNKRGGGYCWLRCCCLESLDLHRIARQEAVCLISIRGEARTTRIDKFELEKLELNNLSSTRVSNRIIPPSELYLTAYRLCRLTSTPLHPVRNPRFVSFRTQRLESLSAAVKLPMNNEFWATRPLEQILDSEFLLCEPGVSDRPRTTRTHRDG